MSGLDKRERIEVREEREGRIKVFSAKFRGEGSESPNEEREAKLFKTMLSDEYQVICLQGVWDKETRRRLDAHLKEAYPHRVNTSHLQGSCVELLRSGLYIASRHPFHCVRFEGFLENFMAKGVLGIQIMLQDGPGCWIFTTQFQSDYSQFSSDLRCAQLDMIRQFLLRCHLHHPALLCGDLSIEASGSIEEEYAHLVNILQGKDLLPKSSTISANELFSPPRKRRATLSLESKLKTLKLLLILQPITCTLKLNLH